ncbi:hypothetical protein F4779DRAFT_617559 [Xylariaceae sp. FL0662B]|nr:hypothetical protein F4779DRAFT_617559 [Xylariaceae sp. FL0662B]
MTANKGRDVALRGQRLPSVSRQPWSAYSEVLGSIEEPEGYNALEYIACIAIRLNDIPKGIDGVEFGSNPKGGTLFPDGDLKSRAGTSFMYDKEDSAPKTDTELVIDADDFLQGKAIVIKPVTIPQFRVIFKPLSQNCQS